MASTNPFPQNSAAGSGESNAPTSDRRHRFATFKLPVARKRTRAKIRAEKAKAAKGPIVSGWPEIADMRPVLYFLLAPAILVIAITVTGGGWPKAILYPIALCLGLYVAISAFRGVELVLACMLIYLPFSKVFVVPIAPGVNGTNMLILLGLFAALMRYGDTQLKWNKFPPGAYLVFSFGILSAMSALTILSIPGGRVFLLYNEILSYKAWIDQFIFYFIALICIRDTQTAKRCVLYVLIGSMLVVLYAVPEMLQKMGRSTIDKSRIGGPHLQSNNFGGFVAYTLLPLVALFVVFIKDLRAWLLTPYFLLAAKVLLTTFSRGAYLAILVGGLLAGWYKGRGFLMMWLSLLLVVLLAFPSLMPDAIVARMQTLTAEDAGSAPTEERLDKSSSTRLVLWGAAVEMIAEDPVWGKGFKGFQLLKADYTEFPVDESDPHSMYLYIGSQMGLPSLFLFVLILCYSFYLGRHHSRNHSDTFIRAIGVGGAASTACLAVVCIFGSRAVSLNFTVYFWTLLVAMQVIKAEQDAMKKRKRNLSEKAREFVNEALAPRRFGRRDGDANILANGSRRRRARKIDWFGAADQVGPTRGAPTRGASAYQSALTEEDASSAGSTASEKTEHSPNQGRLYADKSRKSAKIRRKNIPRPQRTSS
jgi:O-antigen ligase